MATVELAAALPVLLLLLLAGLFGLQVGDMKSRCADAAREAARAAARGDSRAVELGQRAVGGRGQISIELSGDLVVVTVTVQVRPYGVGLGQVSVTERAVAAREPEAAGSSEAGGPAGNPPEARSAHGVPP